MKSISEIKKIKKEADKDLLSIPGVHALAIGPKITGGRKTNEIAIKVFVDKKRKRSEIPDKEVIPENVNGVSTDVIERLPQGTSHSAAEICGDTTHYDILRGGINVGCHFGDHFECGTLTAIVFDNNSQFMALISRHVATAFQNWNKGDPIYHTADSENIIASLYDVELYEVDHTDDNYPIDAAVATINDPSKVVCEIAELGPIKDTMHEDELHDKFEAWIRGSGQPVHVQKRGIRTGVTAGTIHNIGFGPFKMKYDRLGWVQFPANSLIEIVSDSGGGNFSAPGDSGSCILDDSNKAVGSLIGGIDGTSSSVANHIDTICKRFNVTICVA